MAFENNDFDLEPEPEEEVIVREETNNRPFWLAVGALGGLFLLALICMGVLLAYRGVTGNIQSDSATEAAQIYMTNTAMVLELAQQVAATQRAQAWTPTPSATVRPTETRLPPTNTPVVAPQATNTPLILPTNERTATVAALFTQAAENLRATQSATAFQPLTTATQLPTSGFADEIGAPRLLALALLLVGVIFLTRRLRSG